MAVLDDPAWSSSPLNLGSWISYNPLRGDTGPERTEVRVGYDDRFIYFGFRCLSDDPAQIRTTFAKRDNAFSDDWVGLSLDSTGAGQSAYHLLRQSERHPDGCRQTRRLRANGSNPISSGSAPARAHRTAMPSRSRSR